jgi:hypothetical protein
MPQMWRLLLGADRRRCLDMVCTARLYMLQMCLFFGTNRRGSRLCMPRLRLLFGAARAPHRCMRSSVV